MMISLGTFYFQEHAGERGYGWGQRECATVFESVAHRDKKIAELRAQSFEAVATPDPFEGIDLS